MHKYFPIQVVLPIHTHKKYVDADKKLNRKQAGV